MSEEKPEEEAAVDFRGQITVPLDGQLYTLRPSMEAICAIETALKLSLHGLTEKAVQSLLSLDEIAVIVTETMKAHGKANPDDPLRSSYVGAKVENVKKMIFAAGAARINPRLVPLLMGALTGGYTSEGEATATN